MLARTWLAVSIEANELANVLFYLETWEYSEFKLLNH